MLSLKLRAVYITIPERSNRGVFWGNCCIFQLRIDITNRKFQIQQYFCLLVHSAVVGTAPDYLKNMLYPVSERASQRALRSATNNDMVVPHSRLKFGERAFSIAALRAWNTTVFLPICAPHWTLLRSKRTWKHFYFVNLIRRFDLSRL